MSFGLIGCASQQFHYQYFVLDADSYDGWLRASEPELDLPLTTCAPKAEYKGACIVLKTDTFLRLKADYLELLNR